MGSGMRCPSAKRSDLRVHACRVRRAAPSVSVHSRRPQGSERVTDAQKVPSAASPVKVVVIVVGATRMV